MVKAAAGGGGRGMRLVKAKKDLPAALAAARAEAESAFGSGELILEKAVVGARHVEIQVLADAHGHVIHLGERDCSVQRRHQKVLEEAPSPAVDPELRARMGAAAVAAAKAIGYTQRRHGRVPARARRRLLLPGDEHPPAGRAPRHRARHRARSGRAADPHRRRRAAAVRQDDVRFAGHAIEARLYAEAPHRGFLPQSGQLLAWRPPSGAGIRVDHGLAASQTISPFYDPLLAKIIAHGATREEARRRLVQALEDTTALGIATNRGFLVDCLRHSEFAAGKATTEFIPKHFAKPAAPARRRCCARPCCRPMVRGERPAAWPRSRAHLVLQRRARLAAEARGRRRKRSPRRHRCSAPAATASTAAKRPCELQFADCRQQWRRRGSGSTVKSGARHYAFAGDSLHLKLGALDLAVRETLYAPPASAGAAGGSDTELRAPMNGKVVAVLVAEGDAVEKGQRLVVVEAMKMQHEMTAQAARPRRAPRRQARRPSRHPPNAGGAKCPSNQRARRMTMHGARAAMISPPLDGEGSGVGWRHKGGASWIADRSGARSFFSQGMPVRVPPTPNPSPQGGGEIERVALLERISGSCDRGEV